MVSHTPARKGFRVRASERVALVASAALSLFCERGFRVKAAPYPMLSALPTLGSRRTRQIFESR